MVKDKIKRVVQDYCEGMAMDAKKKSNKVEWERVSLESELMTLFRSCHNTQDHNMGECLKVFMVHKIFKYLMK